ncbi:MAG: hypothetical protein K2P57_07020 [Burkholderiales bacterium]|nr:hypothetical protein [Burkholderiales bacterium]
MSHENASVWIDSFSGHDSKEADAAKVAKLLEAFDAVPDFAAISSYFPIGLLNCGQA